MVTRTAAVIQPNIALATAPSMKLRKLPTSAAEKSVNQLCASGQPGRITAAPSQRISNTTRAAESAQPNATRSSLDFSTSLSCVWRLMCRGTCGRRGPCRWAVPVVMAVPTVHEHVHQRACQDHQERQDSRDMGAVPNRQIAANDNCKSQNHPGAIGPEASKHGVMLLHSRWPPSCRSPCGRDGGNGRPTPCPD